jgi:hypothetical protein
MDKQILREMIFLFVVLTFPFGAYYSAEECGVMNVFFVINDVVLTPALEGTILAPA